MLPLAACAQVAGDEACVGAVGVHGTLSEPSDLGGGVVGQRAVEAGPITVSEVLRYTECATGETLIVGVSEKPLEPGFEGFDARAEAGAFQDRVAALPHPVSLEQLSALAAEMGLRAETRIFEIETCACRLHYPGLRGGKAPFDLNSVQ